MRGAGYKRIGVSFVPAWKTTSLLTLSFQLLKTSNGLNLGQLTYRIQMKEQGNYSHV